MIGVCLRACRMTGKKELWEKYQRYGLPMGGRAERQRKSSKGMKRVSCAAEGGDSSHPNNPTNPTNSTHMPVTGHLRKTSRLQRFQSDSKPLRVLQRETGRKDPHSTKEAQCSSPLFSPREEVECLGRADDEG